jgi:hypothetical protein
VAITMFAIGCRTIPQMQAVNLSEPGWKLRQGQAVWRTQADAPEIAGEILFATHPDGRTVLQFAKNPIPFVNVQTSNELWQIEFVPQQKEYSGKGSPSVRLVWVHLARALAGQRAQSPLSMTNSPPGEFTFVNRSNGEMVSGFLQ